MKERPILMSGAMVRATLDGSKTQTRRVVKPQPHIDAMNNFVWNGWNFGQSAAGVPHVQSLASPVPWSKTKRVLCPYGLPGDRLWVREAWRVGKPHDNTRPRDILPPLIECGRGVTVLYEAGGWRSVGPVGREEPAYPHDAPMPEWAGKLRPSMFMQRAFSRISLEVTGVRVERLQDISEADAEAEGVRAGSWEYDNGEGTESARESFQCLWDSLAAPGSDWAANPWVWVVEFRRIV